MTTPSASSLAREFAPTGRLRAALNMGNPVLAASRTSTERPAGVTIDLGRKFAALLGVDVEFLQCESAGVAGAALASGHADIGFMAIDPKRAETLHFTSAYVQIEGFYAVRDESPLRSNEQVDDSQVRVVIGTGSAYGLFLQRSLQRAQLIEVATSEEVVDRLMSDPTLHVAAGVRQQLLADLQRVPGLRLLPEPFMTIAQAMAMPRQRSDAAKQMLEAFMAEQRSSGFIRDALQRHGIEGVTLL
ncbi:MAG TPA: transporter substrate-binding domain-containing protein [Ramlibacter sp.]|jgi:polar amino acid transport system substrate-binding protein|nr:transporter substrate-binding domain-containing protein [Ramlibacter sp.]